MTFSSAALEGLRGRKSLNCVCVGHMAKKRALAWHRAACFSDTFGAPGSHVDTRKVTEPPKSITQPLILVLRHTNILMYIAFLLLNHSVNLITHLINLWHSISHLLKSPHPSTSNKRAAQWPWSFCEILMSLEAPSPRPAAAWRGNWLLHLATPRTGVAVPHCYTAQTEDWL